MKKLERGAPILLVLLALSGLPWWLGPALASRPVGQRQQERLELAAFLARVHQATPPGARILLVVPDDEREDGAGHLRAGYLMPGRHVLPAFDRDGRPLPSSTDAAEFVAWWRSEPPAGWPAVIFESAAGGLRGRSK